MDKKRLRKLWIVISPSSFKLINCKQRFKKLNGKLVNRLRRVLKRPNLTLCKWFRVISLKSQTSRKTPGLKSKNSPATLMKPEANCRKLCKGWPIVKKNRHLCRCAVASCRSSRLALRTSLRRSILRFASLNSVSYAAPSKPPHPWNKRHTTRIGALQTPSH